MAKRLSRTAVLLAKMADLQETCRRDGALIQRQGARVAALESEMRSAKRIAGEMSILFPATRVDVDWPERASHRIARLQPPVFIVNADQPLPTPQIQDLSVMLGGISRQGLDLSTHVQIHFKGGRWGYAISDEAVASMPKDVLRQRVTESLGMMIGRELSGDAELR